MEKSGHVMLNSKLQNVGTAAEILYKLLPKKFIPQSVRVVVTTTFGLEHARGTTIPLNIATAGKDNSPRPVQVPLDFEKVPAAQANMVYLIFSVEA